MSRRRCRCAPDDDLRIACGIAGVALTGLAVHERSIGPIESSLFRAVNHLPDRFYRPGWVVMQAGNVVAAPVTAAVALSVGRRRLAARLLISGVATWALAKAVKRVFRRPRPAGLMADVEFRGPAASGLGYVSGHAATAVALGMAVLPELGPAGRVATRVAVPAVGLCRIYVGAHLPLDVVGGAALGVAVDAAVSRLLADPSAPPSPSRRPSPSPSRRRAAS